MFNLQPGGFEKITVDDSVKTCTASLIVPINGTFSGQKCFKMVFTVETGNIRVTYDGSTPDATTGILYLADTSAIYVLRDYTNISRFQAIRQTGTSGIINVQYFFGSDDEVVEDRRRVANQYLKLTVTSDATNPLFPATSITPLDGPFSGAQCQKVEFDLQFSNTRIRMDGGIPTSTEGLLLIAHNMGNDGAPFVIYGYETIKRLKAYSLNPFGANIRAHFFFDA